MDSSPSQSFRLQWRRWLPTGPVTAIMAVNAAVFLTVWCVTLIGNACGLKGNFTIPWLGVPVDPDSFLSRPWTALTYMVTQYDFFHLLFNLLWLYCFGMVLTEAHRNFKVVGLYVAGGLAGAAAFLAVAVLWPGKVNEPSFLCGASAAVLAVMAGTAVTMPNRKISLLLVGTVSLKWLALICFLLAFLSLGNGNLQAQAAHVGGTACGLAMGLAFKLKGPKPETRTDSAYRNPGKRKFRLKVHRNGNAVARALAQRPSDSERLDQLLDKIRLSGYPSLTLSERNELNLLSQRLDKKTTLEKRNDNQ